MSTTPPYDDILEDETLAPLRRNHACLQCKKRKVKCDATRPNCLPCLRSHAHAVRAAQRSNAQIPILTCTWAEGDSDSDEESPPGDLQVASKAKLRTKKKGGAIRKTTAESGTMDREKEKRREEDRETLLARIADLEAKLSGLTSDFSGTTASIDLQQSWIPDAGAVPMASWGIQDGQDLTGMFGQSNMAARVEDLPPVNIMADGGGVGANNGLSWETGTGSPDWGDIEKLFLVPLNWPRNLPSPFLLEHLVETFFSHAPQFPRIIHRPTLLARIRLPPTSPDFPHASLLHAICAAASAHTAWVNNLPPEALDAAITQHIAFGTDLENIEDFGRAQAESAQRSIRLSTQSCLFGPGSMIFEALQATIILSDYYTLTGSILQGWTLGGNTARFAKTLELGNKNQPKREKEPLFPTPVDDVDRESRLATVWLAFIIDSCHAVCTTCNASMDLGEMLCHLPTSYAEFKKKGDWMAPNPQTPESPDLYTDHPVDDSFVILCKASILVSRAARCLRNWHQRDIQPGDDLDGIQTPEFQNLINDCYALQGTLPASLKNVFRSSDHSRGRLAGLDVHVIMVHVLPNLAILQMHEPFIDWSNPNCPFIPTVKRGYEAIIGTLHLIPSNLDVSLVFSGVLVFTLFVVGRIVINFIKRAVDQQQLSLAIRYRADLRTIQDIFLRMGQKFALGLFIDLVLQQHLRTKMGGQLFSSEPRTAPYSQAFLRAIEQMNDCGQSNRSAFSTQSDDSDQVAQSAPPVHAPESYLTSGEALFGPRSNGTSPSPSNTYLNLPANNGNSSVDPRQPMPVQKSGKPSPRASNSGSASGSSYSPPYGLAGTSGSSMATTPDVTWTQGLDDYSFNKYSSNGNKLDGTPMVPFADPQLAQLRYISQSAQISFPPPASTSADLNMDEFSKQSGEWDISRGSMIGISGDAAIGFLSNDDGACDTVTTDPWLRSVRG